MKTSKTSEKIESEMKMAHDSRRDGNEGRARVCARRAAGLAIAPFYQTQTGSPAPKNAYKLLQWLSDYPDVALEISKAADRLCARVTQDHELPHPEDPLADAKLIIETIMERKP